MTPNWETYWDETRNSQFGNCYTFKSEKFAALKNIRYITFHSNYSRSNVTVFIHNAHQITDAELTTKIVTKKGHHINYIVSLDVFKNLNAGKDRCMGNNQNFDMEKTKLVTKIMMDRVGCVVPFIMRNESETKICTDVVHANLAYARIYSRWFNGYNIVPLKEFGLDPPCHYLKATLEENTNRVPVKSGDAILVLVFQSREKIIKQQWAYTEMNYFAEVGGFLGLLLGYSVLGLSDIFSFLYTKATSKT